VGLLPNPCDARIFSTLEVLLNEPVPATPEERDCVTRQIEAPIRETAYAKARLDRERRG